MIQDSRKLDCPAKVSISRRIEYYSHTVSANYGLILFSLLYQNLNWIDTKPLVISGRPSVVLIVQLSLIWQCLVTVVYHCLMTCFALQLEKDTKHHQERVSRVLRRASIENISWREVFIIEVPPEAAHTTHQVGQVFFCAHLSTAY